VLDELVIHQIPVLFGGGRRLFEGCRRAPRARITERRAACVVVHVDRARAIEVLRETAAIGAELGAVTLQHLAERSLRLLGARTWRRGRTTAKSEDGLSMLSPREQEVVELLAVGASNPEIAQQLYLSRQTVEHHVSNALAKVGARNRADLATRFSRRNAANGVPRGA
jgi:DNA-binding NarL/FixJ family response regulator